MELLTLYSSILYPLFYWTILSPWFVCFFYKPLNTLYFPFFLVIFPYNHLSSLQLQTSFLFISLARFTFITYRRLLFPYYPSILTILLTGFLYTSIYNAPPHYVILRCFYLQPPNTLYIRFRLFYFAIITCPRCSSRHYSQYTLPPPFHWILHTPIHFYPFFI